MNGLGSDGRNPTMEAYFNALNNTVSMPNNANATTTANIFGSQPFQNSGQSQAAMFSGLLQAQQNNAPQNVGF